MHEDTPKPLEIDPEQVAQAAALEDAPVPEGPAVLPIEIQEVVDHDTAAQPADGPVARDSETEARIEELRNRGRVGVLTEGTERPDPSNRMDNSEHDSDAIAAVNKANRLAEQQFAAHQDDQGRDTRLRIGETFKGATAHKLNDVAGKYRDTNTDLKAYFEDPQGWEEKLRNDLADRGDSEEQIEDRVQTTKERHDRNLADIGERHDYSRDDHLGYKYRDLERQTHKQDKFRGDLLDLYARDSEKYKAMPTEDFVAQGHEFRSDSWETSRNAALEGWGESLNETLPKLVEDTPSIQDFCNKMNKMFNTLRWQMDAKGIAEDELVSFAQAIEGKESPDSELPHDRFIKALDDQKDTNERIRTAGMHGYFRVSDFAKDLDRSPREQMKEAVERVKVVTDAWVEAGKKARQEYDEKWGTEPQDEEPEPQAA